jgi:hypothetical protein
VLLEFGKQLLVAANHVLAAAELSSSPRGKSVAVGACFRACENEPLAYSSADDALYVVSV